jgi:hypothetical protein
MEQRTEGRLALDQPVVMTLLDDRQQRVTARVKNVSASGVQLQVEQGIGAGTALRIDIENAMALGEVMYCQREGEYFLVGVRLEHVLSDLANLSRILMDFADRPAAPAPVAHELRSA